MYRGRFELVYLQKNTVLGAFLSGITARMFFLHLFLLLFLGVSLFWHCIGTGSFFFFFLLTPSALIIYGQGSGPFFFSLPPLLANVNISPIFSPANIFSLGLSLRLVWLQYLGEPRLLFHLPLARSCPGRKGDSMYYFFLFSKGSDASRLTGGFVPFSDLVNFGFMGVWGIVNLAILVP